MAATRSVTRSILLAVPVERAWAVIGDGVRLGSWLGIAVAFDIREGASGTAAGADGIRAVRVDAVDSAERLVWTWWPLESDDPPSRVELLLEPIGDGARVTVTETVLADLGPTDGVPIDTLAGVSR